MSEEVKEGIYTPLQIANTFINLARDEKNNVDDLTPLKLIKLTYFFYAWYLAVCHGVKPFRELPEARKHGPVFPSVYAAFSHYKRENIDKYYIEYDMEDGSPHIPILSNNDEDKIARSIAISIWKYYKGRDAWDLREITHEPEGPWEKTWDEGRGNGKAITCDDAIIERAQKAIDKLRTKLRNRTSS